MALDRKHFSKLVQDDALTLIDAKIMTLWNILGLVETVFSISTVYGGTIKFKLLLGTPLPLLGILKLALSAVGLPSQLYALFSDIVRIFRKGTPAVSDKSASIAPTVSIDKSAPMAPAVISDKPGFKIRVVK